MKDIQHQVEMKTQIYRLWKCLINREILRMKKNPSTSDNQHNVPFYTSLVRSALDLKYSHKHLI